MGVPTVGKIIRAFGLTCLVAAGSVAADPNAAASEGFPESAEIDEVLAAERPPEGVVFNVMEYDEDALEWVTKRLEHYVERLRADLPEVPIMVVSHGDEMFSLSIEGQELYPDVHEGIRRLVEERDVTVHVCGATAAVNGVDQSEFPSYIDVVPSASTQLNDYREFGYRIITLELTW